MNKRLISTLVIAWFCVVTGFNQTEKIQKLNSLFKSGNYIGTIALADSFLSLNPDNRTYNLYRGMACVETSKFTEAVPYLQIASQIVLDDSDTIASYALGYLACCDFILNGDDAAEETFKKAYKANGTHYTEKFINSQSLLFGIEDFYSDWYSVCSESVNFWFQDTADKNIEKFVTEHLYAFDTILAFFGSNLPRKINFFVWKSVEHAIETLYVKPAFASPVYCCIHSNFNESTGHEFTHVISWYSSEIQHVEKLVFEGAAVYFDLTQRDKKEFIQAYINHNRLGKISIKSLWNDWQTYPQELNYPLGGLLIEKIVKTYGREKFLEFFSNQTYENALKVFGPGFEELISSLENELQYIEYKY
jgi:tetratricopeptide (TPR) repeat protein